MFFGEYQGKFFNGDDPLQRSALLPRSQFIGFSLLFSLLSLSLATCSFSLAKRSATVRSKCNERRRLDARSAAVQLSQTTRR